MINQFLTRIFFLILIAISISATAETQYVTDQLKVGLHTNKSVNSPIVKIITAGTPLEIIKVENNVSFVKEPGGASGWIDNSYLVKQETTATTKNAEARIKTLEESLSKAKQQNPAEVNATLTQLQNENTDLEQQYKSEKVRTGELQVELVELQKRLGDGGSNDSLYEKIDQQYRQNMQLEVQLAKVLEGSGLENWEITFDDLVEDEQFYWRNLLIYLSIALTAGIVIGIYLMDVINRRRHGGFRV